MRKRLALALCGAILLAAPAHAQNPRKDELAIRSLAAEWQRAWNRNDAKTLAGLLAVDADYVTEDGSWLEGRAEFESWRAHPQPTAGQWPVWETNQLTFRFLQPDIAILHITWTLKTNSAPTGAQSAPHSGISTWLLVKLASGWKIRAAQDTEVRAAAH